MRVVCASSVSPSCFLYHSSAPSAVGGVLRPILKSSNVPSDSEPSVNCNSCESDSESDSAASDEAIGGG